MPRRKVVFSIGEYYHIFNRSLERIPIFSSKRASNYFIGALGFYRQENPLIKYSRFKLQKDVKIVPPYLVDIQAFVLMPNHFHLLLRQTANSGITTFMHRLIDSFSHFFNKKNERRGTLFEGRFRSVIIETEEQFLHVHRYIHLNPVTSHLVENPLDYFYSSYSDYIKYNKHNRYPWLDTSLIQSHFKDSKTYEQFVLNNTEYQKSLNKIKNLTLE